MFDKASLKLGLDKAVLQSMSGRENATNGVKPPAPTRPLHLSGSRLDVTPREKWSSISLFSKLSISFKHCFHLLCPLLELRFILLEKKKKFFSLKTFQLCIISHISLKQVQQLSKKEIEDLLRKGAYGALMDEEDEGSKFCEEDIDQILLRRTHTITIESEGKGSTFAKVRVDRKRQAFCRRLIESACSTLWSAQERHTERWPSYPESRS